MSLRLPQFIRNNAISIGEVLYYFQCRIQGSLSTLAVVSLYYPPLPDLLVRSHGTFTSCKYSGDHNLAVINIKSIQAVVAMIPHSPPGVDTEGYHYLVEHPGLDIAHLGGIEEVFDVV